MSYISPFKIRNDDHPTTVGPGPIDLPFLTVCVNISNTFQENPINTACPYPGPVTQNALVEIMGYIQNIRGEEGSTLIKHMPFNTKRSS